MKLVMSMQVSHKICTQLVSECKKRGSRGMSLLLFVTSTEVQAVAHHRWSLNDVGQSSQSDLSVDREADSSDVSSSEASEADFNGDEAENHTEEKSMNGSITNQSDNVSEQSLGQMALVRPRRDYHGRPIPGSEGSTDSLARAAGHHKILFGQNLAATAAPAENGIAGMGFGKRGKPLPMHDDADDEMPREEDVIVSFGIVDILQEYSFAKWFEHGFRVRSDINQRLAFVPANQVLTS